MTDLFIELCTKFDSKEHISKEYILECIDYYCKKLPVHYTYIGIGSAPSGYVEPSDSNDQIIPKFLKRKRNIWIICLCCIKKRS